MTTLRALLPTLALAAALLPQEPAESTTDLPTTHLVDPTAAALAGLVDEERMQADVRELCAIGPRMGGTASGDRAAAHLKEAFEAAGVEAALVEGEEAWCHAEESWSLAYRVLDEAGEPGEPVPLQSAWPWGFSPSAEGTARLSLDKVEDGVFLTSGRPRFLRKDAKPAVALTDGFVTSDGAYPQLYALRGGRPDQVPVFGINAPDGAALRGHLEAGREVLVDYALEATIERAKPLTVVARIPAREGAEPGYLLYCAHGDSDAGGPGADDNASGVAVVLEIARSWAAAIQSGKVEAPPRELRFAVWGTEIGSTRPWLDAQLAAEEASGAPPLLGVINYDQAGYGSGGDQLNIEPDDLPANRAMIERILAVLGEADGSEGFPARWATNKSLGGTDSYVFSGARAFRDGGRPALTLFTSAWGRPDEHPRTEGMPGESWADRDEVSIDYDVYYHSAGDTPENTTDKEPWNMGWCARVGLVGGLAWLESLGGE